MRKFFFLLLVLSGIFPAYSIDTHWNLEPVVIKNGVSDNTIYNVCYGSDGFIWLSTDKGISRYDGFRFRDYPLIMGIDSLSTPLHQAVKKLCEGPDGLYYALLFQGGITCFDKDIEKFLPVRFDKPLELKDILDFCWNDGSLYLVTSQGLFESRIVRKTEGKHNFVLCLLNPEPLVRGKVAHLCSDGKTNLYFSVNQRKVVHYDLVAKKTSLIKEYSVVNRLFLKHGYLWICRLWDDIICYDLKTNEERVISMEGKDQSEFSNSYVTDLVLKDNRTFYLTTWNGLYKLRFDNDNLCKSPFVLTLLTKNEKAFHSSIENKMTSLFWDDKQQILWVGTFGGGVVKFDISDSMYSRVRQDFGSRVDGMVEDSKGYVWLTVSDGGIMKSTTPVFSLDTHKLPEEIKNVFAIAEDKEGNVWIGTDRGLKRLETDGVRIRVEGNIERENGLEEAPVRTIYVNNYNQIYAAYLNVVIRIDGREKDKLEAIYTLQNGLTNGHVGCMVDDRIGNTWAGNNVGVMTIRNGQDAFYNYLSVGNCSAVCRLNDGRLLWANSWGLIFFDPSATKADCERRQLMLTDIEVGGETILAGEKRNGQVILSGSPEQQKKLVFNSDNNDFHLFFSDLRYGMAERKIAYRLLPLDKDWRMVPLSEGLWFNGLSAGKYTLQAKLVFPDGKEGDVNEILVVVKDKWFQTIWAYIAYVLLLVAFSCFFYIYFKKKEQRKQMHRDRELVLKENLSLEKMKQTQKKEIEALRNGLLMLFVQELRTPLSLIIAPLKELQKDNSQISNLSLQVAYRNSLRMVDACDQLLAIYRQGNPETKLEVAPYSVEKMIDSSVFGVRDLLKVYPIDFRCEKRVKKELEFYVNKKKLEFIIHNLLTNAFTHTHYAGTVYFSVCEIIENNVHYVSLTVEDNGMKKVRTSEQLMSENGTLENDLSAAQLGFSIMRQMIEAHHGTILLESVEGKGTKVTVNLPVDRAVLESEPNILFIDPEELPEVEPEVLEQLKADSKISENLGRQGPILFPGVLSPKEMAQSVTNEDKKTILIVEDHKDIRLYLKVLFGNEYNLLMATNGQEGVDMAMKELPDLIICDVMMPIKDGFECCREVKECPETCSIPFIMLTAKVEDDDIIHGLELGADDYVLKPFTPGILKAKVGNLINGRQTLKQMYAKLFKLPGADAVDADETEQPGEEEAKAEDPFITSVIKIVEENICEADFSVKKLASELNMSQPTLYRKVKQSTDYTIIELIRGVRMRRAGVLLKTKQYGVQEVAEMVGYNDIPTFRKHFVDAFGTTPSTYE